MCFDNFIGVNATCSPTATSGFFLNDIGITVDDLNDIVERDYPSGEALAEAKVQFASKVVSNLILGHFGSKLKASSLIDSQRIAHQQDNALIDTKAAEFRGIELEVCNTDSFTQMSLSQLVLHTQFTGDIEVKIFDLMEAREIDSITVSVVADVPTRLDISKVFKSDRRARHLFIGYDATDVDSYQYSTHTGGCTSCKKGCLHLNSYLKVRGGSMDLGALPTRNAIEGDSYTGGISLMYSIDCDHELWLCSIKNLIALPILYKSGSLIAQHAMDTNRLNDTVFEDWKGRLESLEFHYREAMDNVVRNIKIPNDTKCFTCNSPVRHAIVIP